MVTSPVTSSTPTCSSQELAERGWRIEAVPQPNGTIADFYIPLTEAEFLHPKEGYHLPTSTFHERIIAAAIDILTRRYESNSEVGIFGDLLIQWDIPDLKDHCPDVFVAFGIGDKHIDRSAFNVTVEEVRPRFILEVVSPRYRRVDREDKVLHYARANVQEYMIVDRRKYRGQILDEVLGYRLVAGHYQPITPDEEGRILCETLGLWISLREGALVMEDVQTGDRLPTSGELQAQRDLARQEAAQARLEATQAQQEATQAQQQAEDLVARLARYQERFGELPEA
jgi:Uma2 family endonuclease